MTAGRPRRRALRPPHPLDGRGYVAADTGGATGTLADWGLSRRWVVDFSGWLVVRERVVIDDVTLNRRWAPVESTPSVPVSWLSAGTR